MSEKSDWEKYRDASLMMHSVDTIGAQVFGDIVIIMIADGAVITRQSVEDQIRSFMGIALQKESNEEYFPLMLAHAFLERRFFSIEQKASDVSK